MRLLRLASASAGYYCLGSRACLARRVATCRASLIFVRVQARVIGPVLLSVSLSVLLLGLAPAIAGNCQALADTQVGNLSVMLSMTCAAMVVAIL